MVAIAESNKCNEGVTKISKQIQTTAYKYCPKVNVMADVNCNLHSLVKSAGTITSEWRPKFPILFVNKILSLLFRAK